MENNDRNSGGKAGKKAHYCVLYTQVLKQWKVSETLRRALPEGEGEVFYPCRELWWHGLGETVFRPLFPGYVFIRSEVDRTKLHELVSRTRREILSFVKELGAGARRAAGEDMPYDDPNLIDLTDEEAEFFDFLLGFQFDAELDRRREEAAAEGRLYKPAQIYGREGQQVAENRQAVESKQATENKQAVESKQATENKQIAEEAAADLTDMEKSMAAELQRRKKQVPGKGVVQMSFGYMEGGRYVVMDGPLKGNEEHIKDYIAKDKKACLDIGIGGRPAKVGLALLGKKVWFPKDKSSPDILPDGTVFDTWELARRMMGGK